MGHKSYTACVADNTPPPAAALRRLTADALIEIFNPGPASGEQVSVGGSRTYPELQAVEREVASYPPGTVILTGDTFGVDAAARQAALRHGLELRVYHPRFENHPTRTAAYFARNRQIIADASRLVSFWDGVSVGTSQAIDCARSCGVPVSVRRPPAGLGAPGQPIGHAQHDPPC